MSLLDQIADIKPATIAAIPAVTVACTNGCTVCGEPVTGYAWVCSRLACHRKAEADYDARIDREFDDV